MNIVNTAISVLVSILGQSDIFERIKHQINKIEDTNPDKPGLEKKATLMQELKIIGVEVSGLLLNVLIELAVLYIKGIAPVATPVVDAATPIAKNQLSELLNALENVQS